MTLTLDESHVSEAAALLLQQFKDKDSIAALLGSFTAQVQAIEVALWALYDERNIDAAEGAQLDALGTIINVGRLGDDDDDYRLRLRVGLLVNASSGTVEDIIEVATTLLGDVDVVLIEYPDAEIDVDIITVITADEGTALSIAMHDAKAAGVRVVTSYFTSTPPFTFDGSTGEGFAGGPGVGGHLGSASEG